MHDHKPRRGFLVSAAAGLLALGSGRTTLRRSSPIGPDERWLTGLKGKHRQFFDVGSIQDGKPLRRVHHFLATYASAYSLRESDIDAVFGAHAAGLVFTLGDAAWARFELGALYGVPDTERGAAATRNIFVDIEPGGPIPPAASISRLRDRGVVFLSCNNTITTLSEELARSGGGDAAEIARELRGAVLPWVTIVPAMLIAGNRAQEEGLSYAAL